MKTFEEWLQENWGDAWGKMQDDRAQAKFAKPGAPASPSNQVAVKNVGKALVNPKSDLFNSVAKQKK